MKIKKLSRSKKWLAIGSSTAVASSLLLMFAGLTISKVNDVKQVNNIQNQALQNRSVQPRAGHAIEGDYLLDSNNAIRTLNKNGTPVSSLGYTAMRSDGIGIGPKGYLMLNRETSRFDYIGYDGKVIWSSNKLVSNNMSSPNADPGWPIYVDYDDDQNVFTTWSKGVFSSGSTYLKFMAIDADNGNVLYDWHPTNSVYDFSANSYQEVLITKMDNTPSNLIGYTVIQGNIKKLNEVKYMTIYFGKNNKPSTPPNSTSFISDGIQYQDESAWASIQLVSNSSGGSSNGHILRAKAFYRNGDHYLFFIIRFADAWSSNSSYMSYVVHKNGVQQTWVDIVGETGALTGSGSKYGTQLGSSREGAIYVWPNLGVDIQFYVAESDNYQYIWLLNYRWDNTINHSFIKRVLLNTAGTNTIDFDTYNYRFYKNSFYGFGNNWYSDTDHYDSVMILNLGLENSRYENGDNFNATNDNIKTISFPQSLYGAEHKNKRIGIFPSYSSKNRPFVDVNLNLNGISESNSPFNNAILTITPDGNYAYNTSLTGSEIDISSNATLNSIAAHKSSTKGNTDALKADNFKLLRQAFTRFNESTDIRLTNYYSSWSYPEQQNLCAQGKIAFNITITKAYGTSNGNLTRSVSEQTYGPVILSGYVKIPNTLVIDQDKNATGNQVNLANISLGSNKVNTILPSQINEEQLKTWMLDSENWKQYLDENTVPRGFSKTNIQNISIENKNDKNGTVTVKFGLNSSFKNLTYSTNLLEYQVDFTGFKIQHLNTNLTSQTVDASRILQIYNTSPYQLSNNLEELKTKISENADQIFKDLVNNSLSAKDININRADVSFINATTLQISLTIPAYVDNVQTTNKFTITINNLTNKQTGIDNDVTVDGELANKGNQDPEIENLLKQFIIDNTKYWAMNESQPSPTEQTVIINSALEQLQLSDINLEITDTSTPGQVTATVQVKKYIQANGKYIDANKNNNSPLSKTVVFKGFNNKQTTAKTNTISADSKINSYTAYQISQDQVKEFIVTKQANLWNDLPESSFTKDDVVIVGDLTPSTKSNDTQLVVKVKIPAYVSGSVVNTSASSCPEWTITITGFAKKDDTIVASSTIAATKELAKLWPSSSRLTTDAIKTWLTSENNAKLNEVFSNLPDGVVTADIKLDSNFGTNGIQILNATSIKVKLTLNKAWKNNVIVPFETPVELTINTLVDATTNVENQIAVDGDLATKNVNDVDNAALLSWFKDKYQAKNLIINLDKFNSFSVNNITKIEIIQNNKNPSQGTIDANIYLNRIIQNGIEQDKEVSFSVKFTNFTPLHDLSWVSSISATGSNIASLNPYDLSNQTNYSKIKDFIVNKQDEIFNHNSIFAAESLKDFSASVVDGTTIRVSFQVAGIKDGIQNNTINVSFNITDLTKLSETTIIKTNIAAAEAKWDNISATSLTIDQVKTYIWNNKETFIKNPINSLAESNIEITKISEDASAGQAVFKLKINKYIGADGTEKTTPALEKEITVTGLLSSTTSLKVNEIDASSLNKKPYEINEDIIKKFIIAKQNELIQNPAKTLTVNDISNIQIISDDTTDATSVKVKFTIPANQDGSQIPGGKEFTLKLTNLINGDTTWKSTIQATGEFAQNLASDIVKDWRTKYENDIKTFISNNSSTIFQNYSANTVPTNDITISSVTAGSTNTSINISISLTNAYKDGKKQSVTANFSITNFKDPATIGQSTLASSSLNYTDSDFSAIFNGYSVYGCDWLEAKYTSSSTSKNPLDDMKNYLNKNAQKWFHNLPKNSQNPVINVEFSNKTVNSIILVVKFNGYTGQGATIGEITQNITLTLKATPSFNEIIPSSDINANAFNNWLTNKGESWPTDKANVASKLDEFVKSVVANKNLIPGQNIPNIYNPINIQIDETKIIFEKDGTISLSSGAITINPNTGTNKITSQGLTLKNTNDNSSVSIKDNSPNWLWIVIIAGAAGLIILLLVLINVFARYKRKEIM